jgi:sorting nexin-27
MIRQSGKQVKLTVISVSEDEARRLEPESSSSTTAGPGVEYYERRSVPVSVPEFEKLMENGKEYVTYNIHMAGKKTISRRYREFDALNNNVRYTGTMALS